MTYGENECNLLSAAMLWGFLHLLSFVNFCLCPSLREDSKLLGISSTSVYLIMVVEQEAATAMHIFHIQY